MSERRTPMPLMAMDAFGIKAVEEVYPDWPLRKDLEEKDFKDIARRSDIVLISDGNVLLPRAYRESGKPHDFVSLSAEEAFDAFGLAILSEVSERGVAPLSGRAKERLAKLLAGDPFYKKNIVYQVDPLRPKMDVLLDTAMSYCVQNRENAKLRWEPNLALPLDDIRNTVIKFDGEEAKASVQKNLKPGIVSYHDIEPKHVSTIIASACANYRGRNHELYTTFKRAEDLSLDLNQNVAFAKFFVKALRGGDEIEVKPTEIIDGRSIYKMSGFVNPGDGFFVEWIENHQHENN